MVSIQQSFKLLFSLSIFTLFSCEILTQTPHADLRPTAEIQRAFSPTWSPTGERVAFLFRTRKNGAIEAKDAIYTSLLDGSDPLKIKSLDSARYKKIQWSPNGEYFLLESEKTQEIHWLKKNGLNQELLARGEQAVWHPGELKFVYLVDNDCHMLNASGLPCQRQLKLYDIRSRSAATLPVELPREVIAPRWSEDGRKITWLSTRSENTPSAPKMHLESHTFDIASADHQTLTLGEHKGVMSNANWSHDNSLVSYDFTGNIHLYFMSLSESFSITEGVEPSMGNDNARVLYSMFRGDENHADIALFNRNDHSVTTVIEHRSLPLN